MIIELDKIKNKELSSDICIIGGGPAGLTIANNFIDTNYNVILIESGSLKYNKNNQILSTGFNEDFGEYPFPSYSLIGARVRALGGSSLVWRGWSGPLQEIDFREKHWVPNSGWPIELSDLIEYYAEAQQICDLGPYMYDKNIYENNNNYDDLFDSNIFKFNYWQFPPKEPTRFGKKYFKVLKNSKNIKVILNANLNDFVCNDNNSSVNKIKVVSIINNKIEIRSKFFVLAAGGIENARLILNHNKKYNINLGNHNNNVGSYFMEHPHCVCAEFFPNKYFMKKYSTLIKKQIFDTNKIEDKTARIGWGMTINDEQQAKNKILNSCLTFNINRFLELPSLISLLYFIQAKNIPLKKRVLISMLINDLPSILKETINTFITYNTYNKYKLPKLYIYSRSEQSPNYFSKVKLSNEKDSLGMYKVILNWKMSQLDKLSIAKTVNILGTLLNIKYGIFKPRNWLYESSSDGWISSNDKNFILGIGHHMGTTRMSDNENSGVVDINCKMHGLSNLYIAGSSVFPTGGYVNPTLTIVALSLRLSNHLKKLIK